MEYFKKMRWSRRWDEANSEGYTVRSRCSVFCPSSVRNSRLSASTSPAVGLVQNFLKWVGHSFILTSPCGDIPILHQAFITVFLLFAQVVLHWEVFKDDVFIVSFLKRVHFTLVCSALCCVCPHEAVAPFLVVTRVFYVAMCSLCKVAKISLLSSALSPLC